MSNNEFLPRCTICAEKISEHSGCVIMSDNKFLPICAICATNVSFSEHGGFVMKREDRGQAECPPPYFVLQCEYEKPSFQPPYDGP